MTPIRCEGPDLLIAIGHSKLFEEVIVQLNLVLGRLKGTLDRKPFLLQLGALSDEVQILDESSSRQPSRLFDFLTDVLV